MLSSERLLYSKLVLARPSMRQPAVAACHRPQSSPAASFPSKDGGEMLSPSPRCNSAFILHSTESSQAAGAAPSLSGSLTPWDPTPLHPRSCSGIHLLFLNSQSSLHCCAPHVAVYKLCPFVSEALAVEHVFPSALQL